MISGLDNVLAWFDSNKAPYWRLRSGPEVGAHLYGESGEAEGLSLTSSKNRLIDQIKYFSATHTRFFLECWDSPGQKKERFKTYFEIKPHDVGGVGNIPSSPVQVGMGPAQVAEEIQKAIAQYKAEVEMKELREKVKKLEQEVKENEGGPIGRIADRLTPFIPNLMKAFNIKAEPMENEVEKVSGLPANNNTNQDQANAESRVAAALEKWAAADPDFINVLERVANMAANDSGKYKMAKGFL
jgi:hypothetical protein